MGVALVALLVLAGMSAARASAFVYWGNSGGNSVGRANLDGSDARPDFVIGASGVRGVALDGAHMYWGNHDLTTIGRANLDGSDAKQDFMTGASHPWGVAVDGAHIYWGNDSGTPSGDAIGRADIDGTGPQPTFIPNISAPRGVALDVSHVYWAHFGGSEIGRANLDGTNVKGNFITGASGPIGVAVDNAHIYWTNSMANTIGRANLDGTDVKQDFIAGVSNPQGVAVDNAHIYWANNGTNAIARANIDGSDIQLDFITAVTNPFGVAVDSLPLPATTPPALGGLPLPSAAVRAALSGLSQTHSVFAVGGKSTPLVGQTTRRIPRGTTFSFRLDQPATVTVRIQRKLPGRRVGRVCKRPTRQLRHRPLCTRLVTKATLRRNARLGLNKIAFSGRIRGRALAAGRYRAAFTATNSAGTSPLRALSFRIVAP